MCCFYFSATLVLSHFTVAYTNWNQTLRSIYSGGTPPRVFCTYVKTIPIIFMVPFGRFYTETKQFFFINRIRLKKYFAKRFFIRCAVYVSQVRASFEGTSSHIAQFVWRAENMACPVPIKLDSNMSHVSFLCFVAQYCVLNTVP